MYARRVLTERRRKTKPSVTPAGARCGRPATELRRTRYRVGLSGPDMLFVPFRDGTSGRETYGAGRYLDIRVEADDRNVLGQLRVQPVLRLLRLVLVPAATGRELAAGPHRGWRTHPVAVGPMDQPIDAYQIRLLPRRSAACARSRMRRARSSTAQGSSTESLDVSFPLADLVDLVDAGQGWVACSDNDVPVGMVIASVGGSGVRRGDGRPAFAQSTRTRSACSATITNGRRHGHAAITLRPSATCLGMARSIGRTASATWMQPSGRRACERSASGAEPRPSRRGTRLYAPRPQRRTAGLTLDERSETRFSPAVSRPGRPPRGRRWRG